MNRAPLSSMEPSRDDAAVKRVVELTGSGTDAVLECVGSAQSFNTALRVGRPGAVIGRVGLRHGAQIPAEATVHFAPAHTVQTTGCGVGESDHGARVVRIRLLPVAADRQVTRAVGSMSCRRLCRLVIPALYAYAPRTRSLSSANIRASTR
ncbi:MAG: zinc-binding dehydrogenase [Bifidobacterium thermacidophilum]|uniref:zinc-binding dehydrogenase n=1 Tax=Bifidobacterium thermacidophilum TaxID=246618 RepID=UPI002F3565CE